MKEPRIPMTEAGEAEPQRDQEHAHLFFDIRGIGHHEFASEDQTVNAGFYCSVLRRLREDIRRKDLNCGARAIGCSVMTMHHLTELS